MAYPYRAASVPFPQAGGGNPYPYAHASPRASPQPFVEPGSMTFTKEKNKFGISEYCIYRAQRRTVMGPGGPVEGIQWILINKVDRPPLDIVPAGPEVYATFGKSINEIDYQRMIKEWERLVALRERERAGEMWERDQATMTRQEEKWSARHIREWEAERRLLEEEEWQAARMAQAQQRREAERRMLEEEEWEAARMERRPNEVGFDIPYARGRSRSRTRARANSFGEEELARQFAEMEMADRYPAAQTRTRRISFTEPVIGRAGHGSRQRRASLSHASNAATYDPGVPVGGPPVNEYPVFQKSPYPREARLAHSREVPVYPYGHPREGEPILDEDELYEDMHDERGRMYPGAAREEGWGNSSHRGASPRPRSRSRRPSIAASANELPDAFTRPPSNAVSYTPFKAFSVLRNMDDLWEDGIPPLPATLLPHDVHHEEWNICMQQIDQVWSMQTDVRKKDKMAARIIDYWNTYFFNPRKVELILLKGSQHRSGQRIGLHDPYLGGLGDDAYVDESESSISSNEFDWDQSGAWYTDYRYAKDPRMAQIIDAKRRRKEQRRQQQQTQRRHHQGRELHHSLFATCLEDEEPYRYPIAHSRRSPYSHGSAPVVTLI